MWESKHKCSALESSMLLAASFWKVCGHLGGIFSHLYYDAPAQWRLILFSTAEDKGLHFLSDQAS